MRSSRAVVKFAAAEPREVAPRTFRFVASTGEVDRMGDVIDQAGWQLDNFRKNPVILAAHDSGSFPVARASRVWVEAGRLMVDIVFPPDAGDATEEAYRLVKAGLLGAVSVGFLPLETEPIRETGGLRFVRSELLEVSLVSIPANAQALIAASLRSRRAVLVLYPASSGYTPTPFEVRRELDQAAGAAVLRGLERARLRRWLQRAAAGL